MGKAEGGKADRWREQILGASWVGVAPHQPVSGQPSRNSGEIGGYSCGGCVPGVGCDVEEGVTRGRPDCPVTVPSGQELRFDPKQPIEFPCVSLYERDNTIAEEAQRCIEKRARAEALEFQDHD